MGKILILKRKSTAPERKPTGKTLILKKKPYEKPRRIRPKNVA
ncbi:MAG TPA: hypothetical protein PLQ20_03210 [Candidatus Paceibacterota bacterium]|nr:hypothetical protein [Candidatus Paceibacterota bacterium]